MTKQVLYAGDQMRLGNTIKALADMIHMFEVFDQNVQGKGKFCATGVLSPLKIHNHPDDPHHNPDTVPHISEDSDFDKIERMQKIVRVVGDVREKWVIT
jgi:hypothetical protein